MNTIIVSTFDAALRNNSQIRIAWTHNNSITHPFTATCYNIYKFPSWKLKAPPKKPIARPRKSPKLRTCPLLAVGNRTARLSISFQNPPSPNTSISVMPKCFLCMCVSLCVCVYTENVWHSRFRYPQNSPACLDRTSAVVVVVVAVDDDVVGWRSTTSGYPELVIERKLNEIC